MESIEVDTENSPSSISANHALDQEIEYIEIKEETNPAASEIEEVTVKQEEDPEAEGVNNTSQSIDHTKLQESRSRELSDNNLEKSRNITSEHIHFLLGTVEDTSHTNATTHPKEGLAVTNATQSYKQTKPNKIDNKELSDDSNEESEDISSDQSELSSNNIDKTSQKTDTTQLKEHPTSETSRPQMNYLKTNIILEDEESHFRKKSTKKRQLHSRHENAFVCRICGKPFSYYSSFSRHMRTHTGERPYTCSDCDKSFTVKNHLICHMRVHTGERPFICNICKKLFTQKASLDNHMRTHTGERPFICTVCSKAFCQSSNLNKHMRTHT